MAKTPRASRLVTAVSYMNFVAGLLAAVGTGYFAAIPLEPADRDAVLVPLLVSSVLWVAASVSLAAIANQLAGAYDELLAQSFAALRPVEQAEIVTAVLSARRTLLRLLWWLFAIVLALAIASSLTLIFWSEASTGLAPIPSSSPSPSPSP